MRHQFLYFLQDDQNRFYSVQNGVLNVGSNPKPLIFSPDGWQQISIKISRNTKYFGIDRAITIPYSFVEDGAEILKAIVYGPGIEAPVFLTILELNLEIKNGTYAYYHKLLFKANVDLSTFHHSEYKVTCTLLESGLAKYLKANENTTYEIPLNEADAINVIMDGIFIQSKAEYLTNDGYEPGGNYARNSHLVGIDKTVTEPPNLPSVKTQARVKVGNSNTSIRATNNWFYKAVNAGDVTLEYDFEITTYYSAPGTTPGPTAQYQVQVRKITEAAVGTGYIMYAIPAGSSAAAFNVTKRIKGTLTVPVLPGDELYLFTVPFNYSAGEDGQITNYNTNGNFYFNASFRYRKPQTIIKGYRPADLFKRLIDRVTEGKYTIDASGLFSGDEVNKIFTSGDGIRGIEDAVIKINLADFFEFWDTWQDAGLTLTTSNKVTIQRKKDLIDYTQVTDLGEISKPQITVASDYRFNVLKIGYPDKQVEGVNGRQAFNNTFEWTLGAKAVTKVLDKTCKIIADPYYQEITRITYDGQRTTDSKLDNDPCVVVVGYSINTTLNAFPLLRNPSGITGLLEPETVYNTDITPKKCLLNNGAFLRSCMQTGLLKFANSSKNSDLATLLNGVSIAEKEDVQIVTLSDPYFKPFYLSFETAGLDDLIDQLDVNPLKVYRFTLQNQTYIGVPVDTGIEPSTRKAQTFKLLCGKDTDLIKLIQYNG